jgi:hypothetical protein
MKLSENLGIHVWNLISLSQRADISDFSYFNGPDGIALGI